MKKNFGYVLVLVLLLVPALSFAAEFRAGKQALVSTNEQISNDVYMAGGSVLSAGSVSGDLTAAGGDIIVSGNVGSDVIVAGGNISVLGSVGDDVRAAGGNIVVQGSVGGDVVLAGGEITVAGPSVHGDVVIRGGSVYLNGPIAGNIDIAADVVKLGPSAVISGNMTYKAGREMEVANGAIVTGKITYEAHSDRMDNMAALRGLISIILALKFLSLLICSLLVGLTLKRYSQKIVSISEGKPLLEFFRGLIVMAALPVISIFLLFTVVGIPFGIIGLLGFIILCVFACILTPVVVGSAAYNYFSKKDVEVSWKTITVGVLITTAIGLIPFIGGLVQGLLMLITLGCIVSLKWQFFKGSGDKSI